MEIRCLVKYLMVMYIIFNTQYYETLKYGVKCINLPASANCMMKKFIRDLRFSDSDIVTRAETFLMTINASKTHRNVTCSV